MRAPVAVLRRAAAAAALALAAAGTVAVPPAPGEAAAAPRALAVELRGAITGGTVEILTAALRRARDERLDLVAISLDTPGGALDATREIVQLLLSSDVPVLVWVGPAGAHAASAGTLVTMAANVAAMHPASNIGAVHPVLAGGKDVAEQAGKDMAAKVENDTAALARSIARERGRNGEWAEQAVRQSVSVTGDEAVKLQVVDFVAADLRAALAAADGRKVKVSGGPRTLRARVAGLLRYEPTIRQRLLSALSDPNVVALLMLLGTLGIAVEFYHPGLFFPGAVGAIALLLAFLAMRVIPVNAGAVVLVLAGVGLLVAEGYLTTHGVAGVGGAVCIVLGTAFFIDRASPDYQFAPQAFTISPWVVWPTPIALAAVIGFMAWKVGAARRAPLQLGISALVGEEGETLGAVGPGGGQVFVHGEYWQARSDAPIPEGARVKVAAVDGLTLTVVAAPRNG